MSVEKVLRGETLRLTGKYDAPAQECILRIAWCNSTHDLTEFLLNRSNGLSLGGIVCQRDLLDPRPAICLKSKFMEPQA